ncbi:DUF1456 family protein [Arsukibacterium indicum]|uniref:DUF1456 family protein n=1 Tax=Arsukibacterium indicum TaxID=2848612 RepID=A0ABS6MHZ2_9GAMM|nr:DUF1456 family protein [Arsukibacterium indicum]MBV2128399.1 DUF1456 family protein [Arsukibacterium indicum]
MTNNDVLRRLRYAFEYNNSTMSDIMALAGQTPSREQMISWLSKDDDSTFAAMADVDLARFLNGLIIYKRGKKDGPQPEPEQRLNNNIIFRKLKIALDFKDDDVLDVMTLADFRLSKPELSAFFRRADHKHFRACQDQVLRNFIKGLQLKFRPGTATDDQE